MNEAQLIKAAESGDVSAMKTLAKFYAQQSRSGNDDKVGDIVSFESIFAEPKRDPELEAKAYKYFRMAAEAGDPESMTETARRIYDKIGTEYSDEYKMWYRKAADCGDAVAMRVVAFTYEDPVEKFTWYELSAKLDKPGRNKQDSIKQTAINYAVGRGTEKNPERAELWLAQLDEKDSARAMMEIAQLTGETHWLERAAEFLPSAQIKIAEEFVIKNDFANALIHYKKAAEMGSPDAMSIVGDIFYVGEAGVEQNYAEAFEWYSRAAELDYNMAAVKRALMIYRGLGTEKNIDFAKFDFELIAARREKFPMVYRFNSVARYYVAKISEEQNGWTRETLKKYVTAAGTKPRFAQYESMRRVAQAAYKIADAYFLGKDSTRQSFSRAEDFYAFTVDECEGGLPYKISAAKKLVHMYELGEGVPVDEQKASDWRKKSDELTQKL